MPYNTDWKCLILLTRKHENGRRDLPSDTGGAIHLTNNEQGALPSKIGPYLVMHWADMGPDGMHCEKVNCKCACRSYQCQWHVIDSLPKVLRVLQCLLTFNEVSSRGTDMYSARYLIPITNVGSL
jgi:hypothetical protein